MAKSNFLNLGLAVIFIQVVAGDDYFSVELDGKFTQHDGPYITEILTTGKYSISEMKRIKRGEPLSAPLTFTGTVTLRSSQGVNVFGVNSSFQLTHMSLATDTQDVGVEEDVDTNRIKRDTSRSKSKLEFFGQFALGEPGHQEVIGVRLNLDVNQLSVEYHPATSEVAMAVIPKTEFGFKGNITGTSQWGEKFGAKFGISLGWQEVRTYTPDFEENMETSRKKRETGQSRVPTFNIDGEFIIDQLLSTGETLNSVYGIIGETSFENMFGRNKPSPKDVFYADRENRSQYYFETVGNLTGKAEGRPPIVFPVSTQFRTSARQFRKKRNAVSTPSIEWEYDGTFFQTSRPELEQKARPYGISAKFWVWEISRNRTTSSTK